LEANNYYLVTIYLVPNTFLLGGKYVQVMLLDKFAGYRWKILVMIYACMLSFAMVFQSIPPLLTLIRQEFNIGHAQAGLLMSLFALPGIFIAKKLVWFLCF